MAKDEKDETQYVGEQPTKQQPGQDPDEADGTTNPEDGFAKHGRVVKGVTPQTEDDIPEAGR